MSTLNDLEQRVSVLEHRIKGGRPPTRLNEAKSYLKKKLKGKALPVQTIVEGGDFNQQLLTKARKELGYPVYQEDGIWHWRGSS